MSTHLQGGIRKKSTERPNVGVVSLRSRNGVPSRKRFVVNGQMTKRQATNDLAPPPPTFPPRGGGKPRHEGYERWAFVFFLVPSLSSHALFSPYPGSLSRLSFPLSTTARAFVFIARRLQSFFPSSTRIKLGWEGGRDTRKLETQKGYAKV